MANIERRPHGVRDSLVASAIVEIIRWGWPTLSAWFITRLAFFQGLPDYQKVLVVLGVFAGMAFITSWLRSLRHTEQPNKSDKVNEAANEKRTSILNKNVNQNSIAPVFAPVFNVSQQHQHQPQAQRYTSPPRFTADARITRFLYNTAHRELGHEGYDGTIDERGVWMPVNVALVRFYYQPDSGFYHS